MDEEESSGSYLIDTDERFATVWAELVLGAWVVRSISSHAGTRTYVGERRRAEGHSMTRRERLVAERLGRGHSRKEIGHELGLSMSTLRRAVEGAAERIGVSGMDLVMLAAAFGTRGGRGRATAIDSDPDRVAMHAPLDASATWTTFSNAEREVVELALSGFSADVIAQRRGDRSQRTVANQLAQVFRKASVSGRAELAARLLIG